jgi:hypothetical protein
MRNLYKIALALMLLCALLAGTVVAKSIRKERDGTPGSEKPESLHPLRAASILPLHSYGYGPAWSYDYYGPSIRLRERATEIR